MSLKTHVLPNSEASLGVRDAFVPPFFPVLLKSVLPFKFCTSELAPQIVPSRERSCLSSCGLCPSPISFHFVNGNASLLLKRKDTFFTPQKKTRASCAAPTISALSLAWPRKKIMCTEGGDRNIPKTSHAHTDELFGRRTTSCISREMSSCGCDVSLPISPAWP